MTAASSNTTRTRFRPATREKVKLRMAIDGPSGAGKTYSALRLAHALGKKIGVIDSEHGKAALYKGESPDGTPWDFLHCILTTFSPQEYTAAIEEAGAQNLDVLVIDSLSHAWEGEDGALEIVSKKGGNSYTAWKDVTPIHRRMVEAILRVPCHVIVTMRSKTEYVLETNEKGKQVPRKIGMAPIQRPGMEYEFDIYGSLDWSNIMTVTKSRCPAVSQAIVHKPGPPFMDTVAKWLETGQAETAATFTPVIATTPQIDRIVNLIADLGKDLAKEKAFIFRRWSASEFNQLTSVQAKEYENRLESELKKQKKEAEKNESPPAAGPATNGQPMPPPIQENQTLQEALAAQPEIINPDKALDPNAKADATLFPRIVAARDLLFCNLGMGNDPMYLAARQKAWQQILALRGATSVKDMTNEQVLTLEYDLNKKAEEVHARKQAANEKK